MKKDLKVWDKVVIEAEVLLFDSNGVMVKLEDGSRFMISENNIKHVEPEFEPREMLVWNNGYESESKKRRVIGKFKEWFVFEPENKCLNPSPILVDNAKEIPKELENGKVYQLGSLIVYKTSDRSGFGFDKGEFFGNEWNVSFNGNWQEYPLEDFKTLLIAEAEKRGFKKNICFIPTNGDKEVIISSEPRFGFDDYCGNLLMNNWCIMEKGKWTKSMDIISKQEAELKLGAKIIY